MSRQEATIAYIRSDFICKTRVADLPNRKTRASQAPARATVGHERPTDLNDLLTFSYLLHWLKAAYVLRTAYRHYDRHPGRVPLLSIPLPFPVAHWHATTAPVQGCLKSLYILKAPFCFFLEDALAVSDGMYYSQRRYLGRQLALTSFVIHMLLGLLPCYHSRISDFEIIGIIHIQH